MEQKTGFFEEAPGIKSSTRLNSFLLLLFFMVFNVLWIKTDGNGINGNLIIIDIIMLIAIFVPKYLHKIAEKALEIKDLKIK